MNGRAETSLQSDILNVTNVDELTKQILEEFRLLRSRESNPAIANAIANMGGKVISATKLKMDYYQRQGKTGPIVFLESH